LDPRYALLAGLDLFVGAGCGPEGRGPVLKKTA
jgi:hypothetical protein